MGFVSQIVRTIQWRRQAARQQILKMRFFRGALMMAAFQSVFVHAFRASRGRCSRRAARQQILKMRFSSCALMMAAFQSVFVHALRAQ